MTSLKQRLGGWLIPRLPLSRHLFDKLRLELNARRVSWRCRWHPSHRRTLRRLRGQSDLLVNLGCGPFGMPEGWINLDLFAYENVTLAYDCRRDLPLADGSCRGIHAEHYLEHLEHLEERHTFVRECYRCLAPGGILRLIVPDAARYVRAYLEEGWEPLNRLAPEGMRYEQLFPAKMDVLNEVFLQAGEHYGGYDADSMATLLRDCGFEQVALRQYRQGDFPGGCIDRPDHERYSLYMEGCRQD